MRPREPRLGLAGLMGLVAATGLSLVAYTLVDDGLFDSQRFFFGAFRDWPAPVVARWVERLAGLVSVGLILFGGWTLALPALALGRGRRAWRRLTRGPGVAACLAATVGLAAWAGCAGLVLGVQVRAEHKAIPPAYWSASPVFDGLLASAGGAVAAAWGVQLAAGRWRAQANPYDRIGRGLGLMWLLVGAVFAAKRLML